MPLMGVWAILGLFEFLKKIPTDGGGVTLIKSMLNFKNSKYLG